MRGQQFGTDMIIGDVTGLMQIASFDPNTGLVGVGAGAFWPWFTAGYLKAQLGSKKWRFAQEQTGGQHQHWWNPGCECSSGENLN